MFAVSPIRPSSYSFPRGIFRFFLCLRNMQIYSFNLYLTHTHTQKGSTSTAWNAFNRVTITISDVQGKERRIATHKRMSGENPRHTARKVSKLISFKWK